MPTTGVFSVQSLPARSIQQHSTVITNQGLTTSPTIACLFGFKVCYDGGVDDDDDDDDDNDAGLHHWTHSVYQCIIW